MLPGTLPALAAWLGPERLAAVERERRRAGEVRRDGKFDTLTVVWLCLRVAAQAATRNLAEIMALARADGPPNLAFTVSGFCKARQRFSPPLAAATLRSGRTATAGHGRGAPRHVSGAAAAGGGQDHRGSAGDAGTVAALRLPSDR
jgi:hypothetical protein